jgi:hypothetical protein
MHGMRHRPPLTKEQLRAIWEKNKSPEVRELLWEIHRLRAVVLRADQLQRSLGNVGGGTGIILQALRSTLQDEPCVKEFPKLDIEK